MEAKATITTERVAGKQRGSCQLCTYFDSPDWLWAIMLSVTFDVGSTLKKTNSSEIRLCDKHLMALQAALADRQCPPW